MASKRNYKGLLALTSQVDRDTPIRAWKPFAGGDALGTIIDQFNTRVEKTLKCRRWQKPDIDLVGFFVELTPYNLEDIDELDYEALKPVHLLMPDIDHFVPADSMTFKGLYRRLAENGPTEYRLLQVSRQNNPDSIHDYFSGLAYSPSSPPILKTQEDFDAYLDSIQRLRDVFPTRKELIQQVSLTYGVVTKQTVDGYVRAIPYLARLVEDESKADAAILDVEARVRQISVAATTTLALKHYRERTTGGRINVEPIFRTVLRHLPPAEDVRIRDAVVIEVQLKQPVNKLTRHQRTLANALGVDKKSASAIVFDQPWARRSIEGLGDAVSVDRFSAALPSVTGRRARGRPSETLAVEILKSPLGRRGPF